MALSASVVSTVGMSGIVGSQYCRYVRYSPSIIGDLQPSRVGEVSRSECSVMTVPTVIISDATT